MNLLELQKTLTYEVSRQFIKPNVMTGSIYENLNGNDIKYPVFNMDVENMTQNGNNISYSLIVYYADRLTEADTNINQLHTDGVTSILLLIDNIRNREDLSIELPVNIELFQLKFADVTAGAWARLNLSCADNIDYCENLSTPAGECAVWGQIKGEITEQTDLVDYIAEQISQATPNLQAGENIYFTYDGNTLIINASVDELEWGNITGDINNQTDLTSAIDSARYDDSEVKGMIDDLSGEIETVAGNVEVLSSFTPTTIIPTTTNFQRGVKYSLFNALQRTANLFAGYWNYIQSNIMNLIPNQASSYNQLADKAFVNETVAQSAANFRGNWDNYTAIPTNVDEYPEDYAGNRTPNNNDYLVIDDGTDYVEPTFSTILFDDEDAEGWFQRVTLGEYGSFVAERPKDIGAEIRTDFDFGKLRGYVKFDSNGNFIWCFNVETLIYNNTSINEHLPANTESVSNYYLAWKYANLIDLQPRPLDGTWRLIYQGDWDKLGKYGWRASYRIGTAFTDAQQAALDSTITKDKVDAYDEYGDRITAVETDKRTNIYEANKIYGTDAEGAQEAIDKSEFVMANDFIKSTNKDIIIPIEGKTTTEVKDYGTAKINNVYGDDTKVWNQWMKNSNYAEGLTEWAPINATTAINPDGSILLTNTNNNTSWGISQYTTILKMSKYLIVVDMKRTTSKSANILFYMQKVGGGTDTYFSANFASDNREIHTTIINTTGDINRVNIYPYRLGNESCNIYSIRVYDLTQMFGAGNEPTTYEEFLERKPYVSDEYAYNEGEIIGMNTEGIKATGRNLWDEDWEQGRYDNDGNPISAATRIRSKLISCIPNTAYFFTHPNTRLQIHFYDKDKNHINYIITGTANAQFITPIDAYYLAFWTYTDGYGGTYKNDFCLNVPDPAFNGHYEPYRGTSEIHLPEIATIFPNGLNKIGDVRDEMNFNTGIATKRFGVVDLGTMPWETRPAFEALDRYVTQSSVIGQARDGYIIISTKLVAYKGLGQLGTNFGVALNGTTQIVVNYAPKGTTTIEQFRTAMQGVYLVYELAEPEIIEFTPSEKYYNVFEGGNEFPIGGKLVGNATYAYGSKQNFFTADFGKITLGGVDYTIAEAIKMLYNR